jgi:hypothetical protein
MDRATPNLPSLDLERTAGFYAPLGFVVGFKDDGWMILERGPVVLEFFPVPADHRHLTGSACLRVDNLDALHSAFSVVPPMLEFCRTSPGVMPIRAAHGLRMFVLVDPDGNLLRCLDNQYRG